MCAYVACAWEHTVWAYKRFCVLTKACEGRVLAHTFIAFSHSVMVVPMISKLFVVGGRSQSER